MWMAGESSIAFVTKVTSMYWRQPRGDSLIFEHEWELEKMYRIELVEKVRHILAVRDALSGPPENSTALSKLTMSSSRMNLSSLTSSPSVPTLALSSETQHDVLMDEKEKLICAKVVTLIQSSFKTQSTCEQTDRLQTPSPSRSQAADSNSSSPEMLSPDKSKPCDVWRKQSKGTPDCEGQKAEKTKKVVLVPEIEEVRLTQGVSKKGSICLMSEESKKWTKHWVVIRRPYMFLFRNEKDTIESAIINLSEAEIEYSLEEEEEGDSLSTDVFGISYKNREYWFRASSGKEVGDWLYSIKPLFAGEIKSKLSRRRKGSDDPSIG